MLSYLLLVTATAPSDDPAARFEKYMASAKTIQVDLNLTVAGSQHSGKGSVRIKRPGHMLFQMKWGLSNYTFSLTDKETVAIEHGARRYREYGSAGRLFAPDSDISNVPEYGFPLPIATGSIRSLVPPGTKYTFSTTTFEGKPADEGRAKFTTQVGEVAVRVVVDASGRLLEYESAIASDPKSTTRRMRLSNYKINLPMTNESFRTPLPAGYSPQTLPGASYPLNNGEKMPLKGWKGIGGAPDMASLAAGKPVFVAIGDPDCAVTRRVASAVGEIGKAVRAKGGVAVGISLSPAGGQAALFPGLPAYYDPSEALARELRAPGTPMFLLISSKGTVVRVWYGYDPAQRAKFVADVSEWVPQAKG
jgi:hypothetical protein